MPLNTTNTMISDEENRRIQLEILLYFDQFCKENDLRYYLSDGTLIGAIRHKGYIPWDDDIDVEMPRPDWLKLKELFINQDHYKISFPGERGSRYHCIKIYDNRTIKVEQGIKYNNDYLGIDIDIFAVDGSPDNPEEYRSIQKRVFKLYNIACKSKCGFVGSYKDIIKVLFYRIRYGNPDKLMNKAISLCQTCSYNNSNFATRYSRFGKGRGYRVSKSCYDHAVYKEFEGNLLPVPVGYDHVLRAQYGDYTKLPPVEKRVAHHSNKVFWK